MVQFYIVKLHDIELANRLTIYEHGEIDSQCWKKLKIKTNYKFISENSPVKTQHISKDLFNCTFLITNMLFIHFQFFFFLIDLYCAIKISNPSILNIFQRTYHAFQTVLFCCVNSNIIY